MKIAYLSHRTRVKICGFTRPEDAALAIRLGADAVGLVFHPRSPRHVDIETARAIAAALPPFATVVGLFVDADPAAVAAVLARTRIDLLQFHGDEAGDYCAGFGKPYIKAFRMREGFNLPAAMADHPGASGVLLDAFQPDAHGGTGRCFDWNLVPAGSADALILAGGLEPGNVGAALHAVRPYAVDVSSGVEAGKGIKEAGKMAAFLRAVQLYDHSQHAD